MGRIQTRCDTLAACGSNDLAQLGVASIPVRHCAAEFNSRAAAPDQRSEPASENRSGLAGYWLNALGALNRGINLLQHDRQGVRDLLGLESAAGAQVDFGAGTTEVEHKAGAAGDDGVDLDAATGGLHL